MVEPPNNKDPWGTPPIYYYTLAYDQKQAGDLNAAAKIARKRKPPRESSSVSHTGAKPWRRSKTL